MRICYIADARSIHTQRWVKYFADSGYEVHLMSPEPVVDGDIGKARLHILKRLPLGIVTTSFPRNLPSYLIQIRQWIKKIGPHVLHAHFVTDCGFWAALSGFHPLVLSAWGSDILVWPRKSRIYRSVARFALTRADLILAAGETMIEPMIELGADPERVICFPIGVDTQTFIPNDMRPRQDRIVDSPVVISIRNLSPIYDVETLVRSARFVLEQIPDVQFIIVGEGTQKNYLMDLAASLGVLDSIAFVGRLTHDQLPSYLAGADVYVSTSLSDGSSVSLLEAMACGQAPVVTDVGDVRKWVKDGENGFVIPTKRPDILAGKILALLRNSELRAKIGTANRRLVEERADFKREMGKIEELYADLVRMKYTDQTAE